MRLICPNCDAQYEVDEGAIPPGGRDVQCSNCGHAWFHVSADPVPALALSETGAAPVPPPPAPAVAADQDEDENEAPSPVAAAAPVRRTLDDNLLAILREEAAREAAVRKAEASRTIETQPDLGLPEAARRAPEPPAPPPPPGPETPVPEPDRPVAERPNARRDLLPDIEEINSTLRPGAVARDEDGLPEAAPAERPASFRAGFLSVMIVAAVLVILYVMAPQLAARFPAIAGAMTAYAAAVDALRVWLDGLMQSAAGALRGLTGEN